MIIATTTRFPDGSESGAVRQRLALRTFTLATEHRYRLVCVDDRSTEVFVGEAQRTGVTILKQDRAGVGNARREAIEAASGEVGRDEFIVWMEPEKWTLIEELSAVAAAEPDPDVQMILFMRTSLESYPREQQLTYIYGRILSEYLLGRRLDLFFGPVAFRREVVGYFLGFAGDSWDSIHVPKFRAILRGVQYRQIAIEYAHPWEQTAIESGDLSMFQKRIRQAHELSVAYIREFERHLGRADER